MGTYGQKWICLKYWKVKLNVIKQILPIWAIQSWAVLCAAEVLLNQVISVGLGQKEK